MRVHYVIIVLIGVLQIMTHVLAININFLVIIVTQ